MARTDTSSIWQWHQGSWKPWMPQCQKPQPPKDSFIHVFMCSLIHSCIHSFIHPRLQLLSWLSYSLFIASFHFWSTPVWTVNYMITLPSVPAPVLGTGDWEGGDTQSPRPQGLTIPEELEMMECSWRCCGAANSSPLPLGPTEKHPLIYLPLLGLFTFIYSQTNLLGSIHAIYFPLDTQSSHPFIH